MPTTGQVAQRLSDEIGQPVTERTINGIVRDLPHAERAPLVGRFRRWGDEHVERVRAVLMDRVATSRKGA